MRRPWRRRDVLRLGAGVAGLGVGFGGCVGARDDGPFVRESFESAIDDWDTAGSIGPEEPLSAFEWQIDRSKEQAADGAWSLEVFTEGDHDDGTAWAVREVTPRGDPASFDVSAKAWSESESFNTLRHLVAYLGPDEPSNEESFPAPEENSTGVPDAPAGGLREPLHLAEGWREYSFRWEPASVPETLYLAIGVSVVWEADATHYIDDIVVAAT